MSDSMKKIDYHRDQDGRAHAVTRDQTPAELAKSQAGPQGESMQSINEIFSLDAVFQSLHAPAKQHAAEVRVEAQTQVQAPQTQGRSMRR
jgi:hypothetical protein